MSFWFSIVGNADFADLREIIWHMEILLRECCGFVADNKLFKKISMMWKMVWLILWGGSSHRIGVALLRGIPLSIAIAVRTSWVWRGATC